MSSTIGVPLLLCGGGDRREGAARTLIAIIASVLAVSLSCAARAQNPSPEPAAQYAALCGMCHRAGGMGTGLLARRLPPEQAELETRGDLTTDYVAAVVRAGVGNMPPLSRAEVSDEALAAIAAWLAAGPHEKESEP